MDAGKRVRGVVFQRAQSEILGERQHVGLMKTQEWNCRLCHDRYMQCSIIPVTSTSITCIGA